MSAIKFNHVFIALMLIGALAAFVIPQKYVVRVQPQVQGAFAPVAAPVRSVVAWVHGRVAKPEPQDARDARTLAAENEQLRHQNMALQHALDELRRVHADRANLGSVLAACTPVPVVGAETSGRQSLLLRGSSLDGLRDGAFVLHSTGIVGVIARPPGLLGAQVRLITDRGVRVTAYFVKPQAGPDGKTLARRLGDLPAAVVEGTGDGAMRCLGLTMEQVTENKLAPGDWAILEDKEWDERLHGRALGRVTAIQPLTTAPLYAEIRVEPAKNLARLREVMVLTK